MSVAHYFPQEPVSYFVSWTCCCSYKTGKERAALCSTEELEQLQNASLAASVKREHLRLTALHGHLFGQSAGSKEPSIGLESFIWAHCLVRSRALDLTAGQVGLASNNSHGEVLGVSLCQL